MVSHEKSDSLWTYEEKKKLVESISRNICCLPYSSFQTYHRIFSWWDLHEEVSDSNMKLLVEMKNTIDAKLGSLSA